MNRADKYSEHYSIIWPVWANGRVFVYELSDSGFEPSSSDLKLIFSTCFKQGVPRHSGNYRLWIHAQTRELRAKNIQSNEPYR